MRADGAVLYINIEVNGGQIWSGGGGGSGGVDRRGADGDNGLAMVCGEKDWRDVRGGGGYMRHQGRSRGGGLRDVRVGCYIGLFFHWGFALDVELRDNV